VPERASGGDKGAAKRAEMRAKKMEGRESERKVDTDTVLTLHGHCVVDLLSH
jgi:hypothetical protein